MAGTAGGEDFGSADVRDYEGGGCRGRRGAGHRRDADRGGVTQRPSRRPRPRPIACAWRTPVARSRDAAQIRVPPWLGTAGTDSAGARRTAERPTLLCSGLADASRPRAWLPGREAGEPALTRRAELLSQKGTLSGLTFESSNPNVKRKQNTANRSDKLPRDWKFD